MIHGPKLVGSGSTPNQFEDQDQEQIFSKTFRPAETGIKQNLAVCGSCSGLWSVVRLQNTKKYLAPKIFLEYDI